MSTTAEAPRDVAAIEADIARTRASLNRRLQELEHRLSPSERLARVKSRLDVRRLDPRPHPEWMAVGLVALGAALALAGWRRRKPALDEADLEELVLLDVCEDIGAD
jgi:MYXO-CTERM domain-containing protein